MSVLNCIDDSIDCPLCMEPLEIDDLNFFPCTCGYQICRFCWHRIRTDENGLCPACRKAYPENPADFKPLSQEELQNIKQEKRQRDLQRKQKVTENRKHLANVRVVQKNLVFVVGLSSRLADPETLKKCDYFGKFGKIVKVVINHSTTYAGSQGPSASAYVTYQRAEDALRAIQAVNNIHVDGRILKASLGTTKYCSHFMKNQSCPKSDCMYLHELGDESASFTKEEMQQGKHQEFEKRLQEQYLGSGTAVEKLSSLSSSSSPVLETEIPPLGSIITTNGSTATGGTNSKKNNNNSNHVKDQNHPNNQKNSTADKTGAEPKEGWPTLVSASTERQGSKRSRTKSERNSNRQTPTEENNKRNNRDREKKNGVLKENGIVCNDDESSSASGPHSQSSLSSTPSMQDSCTSSASATPPPLQGQDCIPSLPTPPRSASSPMPVTAVSGHRSERDSSSPVGTTPSSLSSCSDFSSSLPTSQQSQSVASSSVPQSLFSNSFFSNRSVNPLHENSLQTLGEEQSQPQVMQQPRPEETLSHSEQQSQHISYTNGDQNNLSSSWTLQDHLAQSNSDNCSTSRWNAMFEYDSNSEFKNPTVIDQKADDDLGFDPFEETNKALAEDILMERRQEQLHQKHLLMQQQLLQQKQLEQQQQQQLMLQNGLKHLLDGYSTNGHGKDIQGRLPPPGFNGMSTLGGFLPSQPQNFNKMMPGYVGNLPSNPSNGSPQLSGLMGSNRVGGIPPGLNTNILTNLHGGIGSHQLSGPSVMALDGHNVSQAPPGLGISKTNDPFVFKDLDNGLSSIRNVFPGSMNSVSTMNTVNTLNSLAVNNPQGNISSQNNPLSNFLNMAQQRQQTHQFPSHQNLIQQLGGSNMLQQTQKGWSSGVNTDLTSIDPAIVSSGQLTDSRSDSPPMWLKSVDSHDIGMALGSDGGSWGNIPYNLISGTLQASLGNMHPGNMMGALNGPQNTRRSNNMWPPTSPPPGFNSISPLQAKQREGHKIENL